MRFLLDADTFSAIARQTSTSAAARLAQLEAGSVALSVITRAEIASGLARHPVSAQLITRIERLQKVLPTLHLLEAVVGHCAKTRAHLEKKGTPIGPNDNWLAAHALSLDLTVVTGNTREINRVPGLRVENWIR